MSREFSIPIDTRTADVFDASGKVDLIEGWSIRFTLLFEKSNGSFVPVPFVLDTGTAVSTVPREIAIGSGITDPKKTGRHSYLSTATGEQFRIDLFTARYRFQDLPDVIFRKEFGMESKAAEERNRWKWLCTFIRRATRQGIARITRQNLSRNGLMGLADLLPDFAVSCTESNLTLTLKDDYTGRPWCRE